MKPLIVVGFFQANWSFWSRISKLFTSYESRGSVNQESMEMELYWYMWVLNLPGASGLGDVDKPLIFGLEFNPFDKYYICCI